MWFSLRQVPPSFVNEAPWIFRSELILENVSVQDCWDIVLDDNNWKHWHPEVTKIEWEGQKSPAAGTVKPPGGPGSRRVVKFSDSLFDVLLAGPVQLHEHFDVWDESSPHKKEFGFYFVGMTRPNFLTYRALRESFMIEEHKNGKGCKFTRIVAVEPSFLTRYLLGFVVYPRLANLFEQLCPLRFQQAIRENKFFQLSKN